MSDDDFLIPEAVLRTSDGELAACISRVKSEYAVDPDDELYGAAFRYFLLLDRWPELLEESASQITSANRFYNKYYWFLHLKSLMAVKHGHDTGLEQYAFQLLERADVEIDWSVVERIEVQVKKEVEEIQEEAGRR